LPTHSSGSGVPERSILCDVPLGGRGARLSPGKRGVVFVRPSMMPAFPIPADASSPRRDSQLAYFNEAATKPGVCAISGVFPFSRNENRLVSNAEWPVNSATSTTT